MSRDFELPQTLHEAQDLMLSIMDRMESIYGQLNDPERRKIYKSDKEYQEWRLSAFNANAHKGNELDELEAHMKKCFKVEYPTKKSLLLAIQERDYSPPRWLNNASAEPISSVPEIEFTEQSSIILAGILERLIEARGRMSQDEVGKLLGVTGSTVSSWERGRSPITLSTILKLCQIYEVPSGWILVGAQINIEDVRTVFNLFAEGVELAKSLLE